MPRRTGHLLRGPGPTADGYGSDDDWKSHRRDDGQDKGREGGWQGSAKGREDHEGHRGREGRWHGGWKHHDRPHGGVHTGGGGMAASGGGMAAGGCCCWAASARARTSCAAGRADRARPTPPDPFLVDGLMT
ncbi:hypothetical protein NKH77_41610 [Streptomyces sp. M19]